MIPNYITELKNFVQRMLILFADSCNKGLEGGQAGRENYGVKFLNKVINNNDQSKAKHRPVLGNLKVKKLLDSDKKGHGSICTSGYGH